MKAAIAAIAFLLVLSIGAAYGALRTRPEPVPGPLATTTDPVATTTTQAPSTDSIYGKEFVLALGQTATFADGFSVTASSVVEDSRCPLGVTCIQAGTVRVDLALSTGDTTQHQTLGLGRSVTVNGRTFTLTSVAPGKRVDVTIAPGDYRFTLTVTKTAPIVQKCYVGGCSGEICSDTPGAVSTCIFRPEFACYKQATCERQANGQCGWTQTAALSSCLASAK